MQHSNDIFRYKRRYAALNKNICQFSGPSAISGKTSKAQTYVQIDAMFCSGFIGNRSRILDFVPGIADKGKKYTCGSVPVNSWKMYMRA